MNEYMTLLLGLACAGGGGELFIRGAVGIATWARIPAGIIGATVAAFATSSPELSVSVSSALAGRPDVALGDAVGSNVVNVSVILGLALVFSATRAPRAGLAREFPVALLVPIVIGMLALDGRLSRPDGIVLLALFIAWLRTVIKDARLHRAATEGAEPPAGVSPASAVLSSLVGLALLVAAGRLIVSGAVDIARDFGVEPYVIGATIVAIGTSVPEMATTIIAKIRGHQDIALGTILGSNIFNGLFIIGIAATIHPIKVATLGVFVGLLTGLVTTTIVYPPASGLLRPGRGALLLSLYAVYVAVMLQLRS